MERLSIEMKGISKIYPGVKAVDDVDFSLKGGEVHALIGENGAGKSTLMRVLAGVSKSESGRIYINGEETEIKSPHFAKQLGISFIEQEFSLFPDLSVFRNIFIGREYEKQGLGLIDWKKVKQKTREMMKELGVDINVSKPVNELKTSEQQFVEIAKAIFFGAKCIIMDEPTSSMGDQEKKILFDNIRKLKAEGVSIIYISHRMEELFEIADVITVMRDGKKIGTYDIDDVDAEKIIQLMVGRELGDIFYREKRTLDNNDVVLEVRGLAREKHFTDINFKIRAGEVLGLSGLMGSQRTEIMRCIVGLDKLSAGEILMHGKPVKIRNFRAAIEKGIAMLPEDRQIEGIVPSMSVKDNIALSSYYKTNKLGWIDEKKIETISENAVESLNIKIVSSNQLISKLSGGNQQKCIIGKFLALKPDLLILDEPTRGIDVGAKKEVVKIVDEIARAGVAVLLISSELPEILGMSDRILVLNQGQIKNEFSHEDACQESIMSYCFDLNDQ